jgi:hypothetical protein
MPRRSSIHDKKIVSMPASAAVPVPVNPRPSFLQTMKEGISFGVGSSIGHRIVGAFGAFGQPTPRVSAASGEPSPEATSSEEYEQCMKKYDDVAVCKKLKLDSF